MFQEKNENIWLQQYANYNFLFEIVAGRGKLFLLIIYIYTAVSTLTKTTVIQSAKFKIKIYILSNFCIKDSLKEGIGL